MEQLCLLPQMYYQPSPFSYLLHPYPSLSDSYYFVVCPPSLLQTSRVSLPAQEEHGSFAQEVARNAATESCSPHQSIHGKKHRNGAASRNLLKKQVDEEFLMAASNKKNGVLYKKKNTESNVVNQIISFLNCERSSPFLLRILGSEEKVQAFYRILFAIKRANRKYINRKYLKRLMEFADRSEFHRIYLKQKMVKPSPIEMRTALRRLIHYFIRHYSYLSLMTSAKIYKETLGEHFWRKREIATCLFGQIDSDQERPMQ